MKRNLFEDLFLKKDSNQKKLYIFTDKTNPNEAFRETSGLSKEFKKLGFNWDAKTKHWFGDFSKFTEVNNLIKNYNKIRKVVDNLETLEEFVADSNIEPSQKDLLMNKLEQYINDLANATDQAAMDASIRNYLSFYSKFHNYSLVNSWLIFLQRKDATKVASFNTWKKKNRRVKEGSKGIAIFVPMIMKGELSSGDKKIDFTDLDKLLKDAEQKETVKFKIGYVFDISDTEAINEKGEVPDVPKWWAENTPSDVANELIERLSKFAELHKIKLTKEDAKGGEKGYSAGEHINLSSSISGVGELSTLVHEVAHEFLHWKTKSPFYIDEPEFNTRAMKELQAESVSYVVLKNYDIPVSQHPTYLALWGANKDKIKKNMDIIIKCAKYIIHGIDSFKGGEEEKRGEEEFSEMELRETIKKHLNLIK